MWRFCIYIISAFLFVSCNQAYTAKKPDVLIPEAKFEELLLDITLLKATENFTRSEEQTNKVTNVPDFIKNKYGYDSLTVLQNNMYYSSNYKEYEKMNNRILDKLKAMKEAK
nr:DUF4296 domain-containing protein [uncultured Flavobacterium sp.]